MAGKGLYKRAVDPWSDDVKEHTRAKEDKLFEQSNNEIAPKKSKSKAKGTPRADHKHDYKPVIVWYRNYNKEIKGYLGAKCSICGKMENRYSYLLGVKEDKYYGELEHFYKEGDDYTPIDSKKYQKTIFLGGSKIINTLPDRIIEEIIDYMNQGHNILIGDCMGADLQMQKVLEENNYKKVVVYYSGDRPRINLGNWKTKHVSSNKYLSDYERQKLKDNQMAIDCDFGYMLLNGQTKGTMANIIELVKLGKPCKVTLYNKNASESRRSTIKNEKVLEFIKGFYERFDRE